MSEIDYRKEQAAAKLLEFFKVYELLTAHYVEILVSYPEAAEELKKNIPGLADIEKAGEELLVRIASKNK
jgi:hypothetical protein